MWLWLWLSLSPLSLTLCPWPTTATALVTGTTAFRFPRFLPLPAPPWKRRRCLPDVARYRCRQATAARCYAPWLRKRHWRTPSPARRTASRVRQSKGNDGQGWRELRIAQVGGWPLKFNRPAQDAMRPSSVSATWNVDWELSKGAVSPGLSSLDNWRGGKCGRGYGRGTQWGQWPLRQSTRRWRVCYARKRPVRRYQSTGA